MTVVSETVLKGAKHPGTALIVMESVAGFYLGYQLTTGEPYTRESKYFRTRNEARDVLAMLR